MAEEIDLEKRLTDEILCRKKPIQQLLQLLAKPKHVVPSTLFIYGLHSSGKTYVTSKVLQYLEYSHSFVDCMQCYTQKELFGCILRSLPGYRDESPVTCESMYDFINCLQTALEHQNRKEETFIIVLDNCEVLRDMGPNLLPAFLRLRELAAVNVSIILISRLVWEKFYTTFGFEDPISIFFPQYTKSEMWEIICKNCQWAGDLKDLFADYTRLFLSVFFISCRDLSEVQHMVVSNFTRHCDVIIKGKVNRSKLWATILPFFKTLGSELYRRTVPSNLEEDSATQDLDVTSSAKWALSFELPYYSKYFLIAAFLASYSPQKLDKHLFVKGTEKKHRKRRKLGRSQDDVMSDMLLGPKTFSVDRLLAIFYFIVEDEVNFTANISAQVSTLVKLKLLSVVDNSIDHQKFKCSVGLDFVATIAKTLDFDVVKYLFPPK